MRDRLDDWQSEATKGMDKTSTASDKFTSEQDIIKEAASALIALGYKPIEASKMINKLDHQDQTSEMLIKQALKNTVK